MMQGKISPGLQEICGAIDAIQYKSTAKVFVQYKLEMYILSILVSYFMLNSILKANTAYTF